MRFEINFYARRRAQIRSGGICERCNGRHGLPATHIHHLTYERAGHENSEDLQHVCLICHCELHPQKAKAIAEWDRNKPSPIPYEVLAEEKLEAEAQAREHERTRPEPSEQAWNLGHYQANGYCLEDVEAEEMLR